MANPYSGLSAADLRQLVAADPGNPQLQAALKAAEGSSPGADAPPKRQAPPPLAPSAPAAVTPQQQSANQPNNLVVSTTGSSFSTFLNGQAQITGQATPLGLFPTSVGGQLAYVSTEYKQYAGAKLPDGSTFKDAIAQLMNSNGSASIGDLQQKLIGAGLLDPTDRSFQQGSVSYNDATFKAYEALLSQVVGQKAGQAKGLDEYLSGLMVDNPKGAAYQQKYASMFGGAPITLEATHTTVPSAPDLQGDFRGKLQNLVGADPTPEQYQNFVTAAQAFAKANPELVSTEYTTGPGGSLRYPVQKDISTQGGLSQTGMDQFEQSYIAQNMGPQEATAGVNSLIGQFQQMLGVK